MSHVPKDVHLPLHSLQKLVQYAGFPLQPVKGGRGGGGADQENRLSLPDEQWKLEHLRAGLIRLCSDG